MKIGGLYEFVSDMDERVLFSDQQYKQYMNFDISSCISTVLTKEIVVCLDKAIVQYHDAFFGDNGYETFVKVINNKGLIGWVIWRDYEWKLVKNDPNK